MKFDCGETSESKQARLSEWHPFFALFPRVVAVNGGIQEWRWLETIERKGKFYGMWLGWVWEYRARWNG